MRVLLFHPWGRFDPAFCGAGDAACAHLDSFLSRGWEVHCVMQEIPAWGVFAAGPEEDARRACVKSVRAVTLDCPPVAPGQYGDEFRQLLFAAERAARGAAFRRIACERWDAFFTTDVTAVPYALSLPRSVTKVLAAGDTYSRRAATAEGVPHAMREAEERFTFGRIESELYRAFDRVLFCCDADVQRARFHGVKSALHAPPSVVEPPARAQVVSEHDLLLCGGARPGELADAEWFYRHVYVPHLGAQGVRLALAGPVAEQFPADLRVARLPTGAPLYESGRVVIAPACEAPGPRVPVLGALAAGRAVVATPTAMRGLDAPDDAAVVIDMRRDPVGTAVVIRNLLAAPGWRRALGERGRAAAGRHTRARHFAALDAAWALPTAVPLRAAA